MKNPMNPQAALSRAALLLAACLSTGEAVQVATPAQADLQVSEEGLVDGASASAAPSVNALFNNAALSNQIIVLRFDLTGKNRLQSTKAWLKLTSSKLNTTSQGSLYFYGVAQGAIGSDIRDPLNPVSGTSTDNNWPESGTVFSTTPGLLFDADATTPGVDPSVTTYLGGVGIDNGNRDEGSELILSTPELQTFLTDHPDDVVTILITSSINGTSQKRFATKEATSLDTIVTPVPAGTYAPRLFLELPGTTVKASADAQVNEITGSATTPTSNTGNGTEVHLNCRYANPTNGERHEVIGLRFDLTSVPPGQISSVDLRLVNHRDNTTSSNRIHIYGVNDGARGRNAADSVNVEGPYTDNDWQDSSPGLVFSAMPGLEFDNLITTQGVLPDRVTDLGSTYLSAGNRNLAKGTELVFSNERLRDFLNNHPDRIVTILMVADLPNSGTPSTNQKRFASKQAMFLEGGDADPQPLGTYAPSLNLIVTPSDSFAIRNITLGSGTGQITLTWDSQPDQVFRITHSQNLQDGFPGVAATDIPATAGTTTTHTFTNPVPAAPRLFFRVERP